VSRHIWAEKRVNRELIER